MAKDGGGDRRDATRNNGNLDDGRGNRLVLSSRSCLGTRSEQSAMAGRGTGGGLAFFGSLRRETRLK